MNYAINMLKSDLLEQIAERDGIIEIVDELEEDEMAEYRLHLKRVDRNIKDIQDVLIAASENPDSITRGNAVKKIK